MNSKVVFIIAGANGSGKTTFANEFVKSNNLPFLNADEIDKQLNADKKAGGKVKSGRVFFKRINKKIESKESFVIETTLSGKTFISLISKLKSYDYRLVLIYVFLGNVDIAIERVRIRVKQGGHSIPVEDIIRRYDRSIKNFWNIYKNMVNEWVLLFNGEDNTIETAIGDKKEFKLIDEEKFEIFMRSL